MGNMGNTMCTTRACQISFIFPQLITMWCRRQHILFYKIVNSVLLKKKKRREKKRKKRKCSLPKKNKTINNRRKTMMHAWTMLLQQRRITTIRWRIKPKTTTAGKWVTSSFSMFAYNTLERPPSQFCGVARQPKWDRNWGKRRKRKERQGRGGGHIPGICPFIWFCICGAGGPPLTIPSEGMLWPWGGWGGGPLWFMPPGPMGIFWVGGCRCTTQTKK